MNFHNYMAMIEGATWGWVIATGVFGSVAGYMLDQSTREKTAGRRLRFDGVRLSRFIVLGVFAAVAVFVTLTAERDFRATDFVFAALAALKGAEILTILSTKLSDMMRGSPKGGDK